MGDKQSKESDVNSASRRIKQKIKSRKNKICVNCDLHVCFMCFLSYEKNVFLHKEHVCFSEFFFT